MASKHYLAAINLGLKTLRRKHMTFPRFFSALCLSSVLILAGTDAASAQTSTTSSNTKSANTTKKVAVKKSKSTKTKKPLKSWSTVESDQPDPQPPSPPVKLTNPPQQSAAPK
ncbi:hypothetical protein [Neokomagataea tanensis]|nr:hypothetical protein [Neokomagataea tanensis]